MLLAGKGFGVPIYKQNFCFNVDAGFLWCFVLVFLAGCLRRAETFSRGLE
jgi:hypothetical protein